MTDCYCILATTLGVQLTQRQIFPAKGVGEEIVEGVGLRMLDRTVIALNTGQCMLSRRMMATIGTFCMYDGTLDSVA